MRVALAALLLSSGCVCAPLGGVCGGAKGPCPTEADLVARGLGEAQHQWLTLGTCAGPSVGSTLRGSWVAAGPVDFCGEEYFFDRSGELIGKRSCCETDCEEWGFGFQVKRGPITRDLCQEARAPLTLLGASVTVVDAARIVAANGVEAPVHGRGWRRRFELPFGHYTVEYTDGGQRPLEVIAAPDGGLASPVSDPLTAQELDVGLLLRRL